jgi:lysophospholipase L1-like esterase
VRALAALLLTGALAATAIGCSDDSGPDAAHAQQPAAISLVADARERGYISLRLTSEPGVAVTIAEGRETVAETTPSGAVTELERVATWRCDRRRRNFTATSADGASATTRVRTPSCAHRLAIVAPRRTRALRGVSVRIVDRWRLGDLVPRLCVEPPGGPARCRHQRVRARGARSRFRPLRAGAWRIALSGPGLDSARAVRVSAPDGRLDVLATGDSMIQIIDGFLRARLARVGARVRSDARVATGISKPSLLDWQKRARRQAARKPDIVVMFLGANDGFPMAGAPCCDNPGWIAEYARRARRMMLAYGRGGRARVLWLTLPAPRGGIFTKTFPAVNKGIRDAAGRSPRDVRLIDLFEVFTPDGYRESMRIGRRVVRVRQSDGVHLNVAGASHAANVIIRALRDERIIRAGRASATRAGRSRPQG